MNDEHQTPGPWQAVKLSDNIWMIAGPDIVVDGEADALLVAAAPSMRAALSGYHDAVETLLTLPEGGMRDLVITKLADAHLAAKALLA
jgi:hypothetical protein